MMRVMLPNGNVLSIKKALAVSELRMDFNGRNIRLCETAINIADKVFFEGRTCTSIAEEDGVSKAAISNRLKKVYNTLCKKIKT